ncbi:MAG TPA: MBL fold metallo-hydrolase [Syntrophales bacterium]|nr:MBL fold metallo-hydrolase [Syntrophales bacterium]
MGTNGWYDTETGNTISILIKATNYEIILDAGNGVYKLDRHIPRESAKPVYLFLSHFHLDHVVGLHILAKFNFHHGLCICGPAGSRDILRLLVNDPFTAAIPRLPFPVKIYELPAEEKQLPFTVEARELIHQSLTLGYRFEIDGKIVSYCPDTGFCENAVRLARSADILIAECAYKSGQSCESWPHLNPETAARIACDAGAKSLALVHFDADIYKSLAERKESEAAARKLFKNTFATTDDMEKDI